MDSCADAGEKVQSWDANGHLLMRNVVVHINIPAVAARLDAQQAEIDELKEQLAELNKLDGQLAKLNKLFARSNALRVRNIAAQILLAADGKEFKTSKCTRFKARGVSDKGVMDAADALGLTPAQFISKADSLVTRRNEAVHCNDLCELDEEVAEVASIITPALQDYASWECSVVLKYADIKKAFPDGFKELGSNE